MERDGWRGYGEGVTGECHGRSQVEDEILACGVDLREGGIPAGYPSGAIPRRYPHMPRSRIRESLLGEHSADCQTFLI